MGDFGVCIGQYYNLKIGQRSTKLLEPSSRLFKNILFLVNDHQLIKEIMYDIGLFRLAYISTVGF